MTKYKIILILILIVGYLSETKSDVIKITNYKHISKNNTSNNIFYKVCLDGVVYWVMSTTNPSKKNMGRGGMSIYLDNVTLQPQRCKILKEKCIENKAIYKNKNILCYKQFKELKINE